MEKSDSNPENLRLIERAASGDKDAFDQIYQQFFTPVFRFIHFKVSDFETAEDLTQNTFMKAFQSIVVEKNFQNQGKNPLAYFLVVARNTVFDFYRKKKDLVPDFDEETGENLFDRLADEDKNPHEKMIEKDQKNEVAQCLQVLENTAREVVFLKIFRELSYSEIAEILGKKETAVRKIYSRALVKLRAFFPKK